MKMLKAKSRGSVNLGNVIWGLAFTLIVALIAILVAGVISGQMASIFTQLNVNATWTGLAETASSYAQTAITLALVGVVIAGVMVIVAVVRRFGGGE